MKILVINSGSSSLKCSLFDYTKKEAKLLAKIIIDGLGQEKCKYSFKSEDKNIGQKKKIKNHTEALKFVLDLLLKHGPIDSLKEIEAIGNRVVHGGEKYSDTVKIDAKVIKEIDRLANLAPLHNPANLQAIKAAKKILPKAKQVAVFDTAFHQTIPEKAYLYAIPYHLYKKENIRRYGFHGTSHRYVTEKAIKILKKKNLRAISCHLGNGSSITATINGKSQDTSMGLTPLEGIPMGTRSGNIDPAICFHLQKNLKMKTDSVDKLLNKESGLLGLSEISNDMREIYAAYKKKDPRALRTMDVLAYQIAKYIGAYTASLQGLDTLIFTATMGEKAFYLRTEICKYLDYLGVKLDKRKNEDYKEGEEIISSGSSKVKVLVIPTNEELQIAKETKELLS